MPFSAGFDPYFQCGDKSQLDFEIPSGQYLDQKTKEMHPFRGNFDFNRDEIDFAFGYLQSLSATVTDNTCQFELTGIMMISMLCSFSGLSRAKISIVLNPGRVGVIH
jgi:galactose mutarotase-like enzyme